MKHAAIRVVLHWNMAPPPAPPALLNVRAGVRVSQCAVQTCDTFDDCLFRSPPRSQETEMKGLWRHRPTALGHEYVRGWLLLAL